MNKDQTPQLTATLEYATVRPGTLKVRITDKLGNDIATAAADAAGQLADEHGADAGRVDHKTGTVRFSDAFIERCKAKAALPSA